MDQHKYMERYLNVWQKTRAAGMLSEEQVKSSRYYFETDLHVPVPKKFDTYGVVALMPMAKDTQDTLSKLWGQVLASLGEPLAYGVEPQNRHVELILFSRPEEVFADATIHASIEASFAALHAHVPKQFTATFTAPFITPDGTVVVPGFPDPASAIDDFRAEARAAVGTAMPQRQSQWFHISLGRILDPVGAEQMRPCLQQMKEQWGKQLFALTVDKAVWTHEKQWYMLEKDILHELPLG
jgi:hypothetical protein